MIKSKFVGCLLGSALGDAIGELAFKYRNSQRLHEAIDEVSILRYTDDTAMAIGIAEVLCERRDLDEKSLGDRFKQNFEKEPWRGYGPGPPKVFSLADRGYSYTEAASMLFDGSGSFGNGAAMRIAPVGLFFYDSPDLIGKSHSQAALTHAHILGKDGAAVLAKAIAEAVKHERGEGVSVKAFCNEIVSAVSTKEFSKKISDVNSLMNSGSSRTNAKEILGTNVTAHGSVPFSIFSFLKNRDSFEGCLLDAVLAGGDRDTIGAMACAISGAYLGADCLPDAWVEKLENASYIKQLAMKMAELKLKKR